MQRQPSLSRDYPRVTFACWMTFLLVPVPAPGADQLKQARENKIQSAAEVAEVAEVCSQLGDFKGAMAALNKAVRIHPGDADLYEKRARILKDLDFSKEAADAS